MGKYMVANTSKAHKNSLAETIFKKISTMVPKGRFLIASGACADAGAVAGGAGTSVAAKISASASTVNNSATIPAAAAASISDNVTTDNDTIAACYSIVSKEKALAKIKQALREKKSLY